MKLIEILKLSFRDKMEVQLYLLLEIVQKISKQIENCLLNIFLFLKKVCLL